MPLDPEIAEILRTQTGVLPMETLSVEQLRAAFPVSAPEHRKPVASVRDLEIRLSGRSLPARLYRPATTETGGLVVFFHGGGFVVGSLETHDHICRELCLNGSTAVLSVHYRLAPEHRFPLPTDDCLEAMRWAHDNAGMLEVDPGRLLVAGDSAGANLATVTALRIRDEGGPALRAQLLIYPATDYHTPPTPSYLANQTGYSLTRTAMIRFWDDYLGDAAQATNPLACPLRANDLSRLPPALIVTAEFDPLRDEGEAYAHRLLDAGVPVTLWRYDGLIHGFIRMGMVSRRSQAALERCGRWVGQVLG